MNCREKFNAIMHYKDTGDDGTLLWTLETITEKAILRWIEEEGLPQDCNINQMLGFDGTRTTFGCSDAPPIPRFEEKTLSQAGDLVTSIDSYGNTRVSDIKNTMTPTYYTYLDGPMKTRKDFEEIKKHFDPSDPSRYPKHWDDEYFKKCNDSDKTVSLEFSFGPGRGAKNYYMFGFDRFMEVMIEDEAFLMEIFEFWTDYLFRFMKPFISKVKFDYFNLMEDGMAYKNSTIISPDAFRRIYGRYLRKLADFLRSNGIDVLCYYTSGNIEPFIPSLLDFGFNMIAPMEVNAGLDALTLRKKYGRELLMMGNVPNRALLGGKEAIDSIIIPKIKKMAGLGGYIPAIDDFIMPDTKFEDLKYFCDRVREL